MSGDTGFKDKSRALAIIEIFYGDTFTNYPKLNP
jgi:hypothetical protein